MIKNVSFYRGAMRFLVLASVCFFNAFATIAADPPKVGEAAPNFTLKKLDGTEVELYKLTSKSRVALVVLRGWPGYQCPLCERQVNNLIHSAAELNRRDTQLIFVYPGPSEMLQAHAKEFLQNKDWPRDYLFVIDPDYSMISAYGLRWAAPNETAYPSTFIIDKNHQVRFAHISKEHGGRVSAADLLKELDSKN